MQVRVGRRRTDDGAAAVEFALIMIPFMILVLGMIQYGWYFYVSQSTGGAASTIARRIQVGDCWNLAQATTVAKRQAPMMTGSVTASPAPTAGTTAVGDDVTVTVTSDAKIIGFLPMPANGVVSRVVSTRIEDDEENTPCT